MDEEKSKTPAKEKIRLRNLQRQNTRESESLKLVERTTRTIKDANTAALVAVAPGLSPFVRLIETAAVEQAREIIRLRRKLVATEIRLERTSKGLIAKVRSKANEVRELRKKLHPDNVTGRKRNKREVAKDEKARADERRNTLPPLDEILATNEALARKTEKVPAKS
jgi:hypothetical protein